MRHFVRDFGTYHMAFVDVMNADLSRRFVLRPFSSSFVKDVAHSDTRLYCLAASLYDGDTKTYSTELAIFDATTGAETARTILPIQVSTATYLPKNHLLALQFLSRELTLIDADTLQVIWQTKPYYAPILKKASWLSKRIVARDYRSIPSDTRPPLPPGTVHLGRRVFEDANGTIRGLSASDYGDRQHHKILGTSTGLFVLDPQHQRHSFHPVDFSTYTTPDLVAPSPDGQCVLRPSPHWAFGPAFDTGHDPQEYTALIEHQALDLWSVDGPAPLRRLQVGDTPHVRYIGRQGENTEAALRSLEAWGKSARDPYRMPQKPPPQTKGISKRNTFHGLHWEPDNQGFFVFSRYALRRIGIDGKPGPLMFIDRFLNDQHRAVLAKRPPGTDIAEGEAYPAVQLPLARDLRVTDDLIEITFSDTIIGIPKTLALSDAPMVVLTDDMITLRTIPKLTAKDIAAMIPGVVRIKSWNAADVDHGLRALADTIRTDLFSLGTDAINLVFNLRGAFLEEPQFVEQLAKRGIEASGAIRQVIDAWCDAIAKTDHRFFYATDGAGPLAHLLAYLAGQDDNCTNQLRRYCIQRNGEAERFSRDVALKGYLDRLGLSRPDLWHLAILHVLLLRRDGTMMVNDGQPVSDWVHTGLLDSARDRLAPEAFAAMIKAEITAFRSQNDVFAAFGTHAEAADETKADLLTQLGETAWDQALAQALAV